MNSQADSFITQLSYWGGAALALLFAVATVLYDCHVSIQQRLKRVPIPVVREYSALVFAAGCGLLAAVAFRFTDGTGATLIDSILSLHQKDPYLRGICVGLTVLILIRSKIGNINGAEIGGELAYNAGRVWVMQSLNSNWQKFKSGFNVRNANEALAIIDYEDQLLDQLRQAIRVQPEDYRNFVESQIANIQKSKPATVFSADQTVWRNYYRGLTNLALDYAGPKVFMGWTQFK